MAIGPASLGDILRGALTGSPANAIFSDSAGGSSGAAGGGSSGAGLVSIDYNPDGTLADSFSKMVQQAGAQAFDDAMRQSMQVSYTPEKYFNKDEIAKLETIKQLIESIYVPQILKKLGVDEIRMDGLVIAGGLFTSLITGDKVKDIDVFVLNNGVLRSFAMAQIQNDFRKGNAEYLGNPDIQDVYLETGSTHPIQFIFTKYNTREELINHFDYKHCCVSYDIKSKKLFISPQTYDMIVNKKLVINNSKNLQNYREEKFIRRGFTKVAA